MSKVLRVAAKENHVKDFMSLTEPVKCSRSYLNSLDSKTIRLAFFGMYRKSLTTALDTLLGTMILFICRSVSLELVKI